MSSEQIPRDAVHRMEIKAMAREHESRKQPAHRPEPAVGQVWKSAQGNRFVVADKNRGMFMLVFEQGSWTHGSIHETDTYVGQFAGFKVQEEGGK